MNQISVLGAGPWGAALAKIASKNSSVLIWSRKIEDAEKVSLNMDNVKASKMSEAINSSEFVLVAISSSGVRETLRQAMSLATQKPHLIMCCKGLDPETLSFMSQTAEQISDCPAMALSGPCFAKEILSGGFAACDLASVNLENALRLKKMIMSDNFSINLITDVIGAQVGGAIKNVAAICCGFAIACGEGENMRAALVSLAFKEMGDLCQKTGGDKRTLNGLSGIGDLFLTCSSDISRNIQYGKMLALNPEARTNPFAKKPEGVFTANLAYQLGVNLSLDLPLCDFTRKLISSENPKDKLKELKRLVCLKN